MDGREEGGRGRDCLGQAGTREFDLNNWRSEGGGTRQRPMMGHAKQNLTSSSTTPARAGGGAACAGESPGGQQPEGTMAGEEDKGEPKWRSVGRLKAEATHGRCPAARDRLDVSGGLHRPALLFSLPSAASAVPAPSGHRPSSVSASQRVATRAVCSVPSAGVPLAPATDQTTAQSRRATARAPAVDCPQPGEAFLSTGTGCSASSLPTRLRSCSPARSPTRGRVERWATLLAITAFISPRARRAANLCAAARGRFHASTLTGSTARCRFRLC